MKLRLMFKLVYIESSVHGTSKLQFQVFSIKCLAILSCTAASVLRATMPVHLKRPASSSQASGGGSKKRPAAQGSFNAAITSIRGGLNGVNDAKKGGKEERQCL